MTQSIKELHQRYYALQHAMQTGVAYESNIRSGPTDPKHLRVGINTAMVEGAAVVKLLIRKGVITEEEYWLAVCGQMQEEVEDYERRLSESTNSTVRLL